MGQQNQVVYGAEFDAVAISTAVDLFHVTVATDRPVEVMGMHLFQTTDLGDAAEEVIRIALVRAVTGGGTGGTAETEYVYSNAAAGTTNTAAVLTVNTTVSTGGTIIDHIGWNVRIPLIWEPIPELRPKFSAAEDPFVFRLLAAPADAITCTGVLLWTEI